MNFPPSGKIAPTPKRRLIRIGSNVIDVKHVIAATKQKRDLGSLDIVVFLDTGAALTATYVGGTEESRHSAVDADVAEIHSIMRELLESP